MNLADRCEHMNYRGDCVICEQRNVAKLQQELAAARVALADEEVIAKAAIAAVIERDKKLAAAEAENEALEQKLTETESRQSPLEDQVTDLGGQLAESREKLDAAHGLLREALDAARAPDDDPERWYGNEIPDEWFDEAARAAGGGE